MPRRSSAEKTQAIPIYWELLTEEEQARYIELREQFSLPKYKNRRNKSHEVFKDTVKAIKKFVVRNDEGDQKRSLVCGILWIDDTIVINTHQLRLLIDKCKSSINGSFQAIGYDAVPAGTESVTELITVFPFMRNNYAELRQWTVRKKTDKSDIKSNKVNETVNNKLDGISSKITICGDDVIYHVDDQLVLNNEFTMDDETITPPPDLTYIVDGMSIGNSFFSGSDNARIMEECENPHNLILDDPLTFLPRFEIPKDIDFDCVMKNPSELFEDILRF